jgi:hypothetical protein
MYVVFGQPAHRCLQTSLSSLFAHEDVDVHVVSDREVNGVGHTIVSSLDLGARSVKTQLNKYKPKQWTQALYLDVDTVIQKPLDRIWGPLDRGWDMVLCRDETAATANFCRLKHYPELRHTVEFLGTPDVTQYAGGVVAWNANKQTSQFWRTWHAEWEKYSRRDQGALTRTLAQVPLKVWTLEYQANAKKRHEAVEIWHRHGQARQRGAQ